MEMFCGKCGTRKDPVTGLCPVCDASSATVAAEAKEAVVTPVVKKTPEEIQAEKEQRKRDWEKAKSLYKADKEKKKAEKKAEKKKAYDELPESKKKSRRMIKILIVVALVLTAVLVTIVALAVNGVFDAKDTGGTDASDNNAQSETETEPTVNDTYNPPTWDMPEEYLPPQTDAQSYYEQNGSVIGTAFVAGNSRTEEQAYQNLTSRGFADCAITADFDENGNYIGLVEISENGTQIHPMYTLVYVTSSGNEWVVTEVNGEVFAVPNTFNESLSTPVILSETDTVTSYDANTNTFFVTKPDQTVMQVKKVAKINADTLEKMTKREVSKK